MRVNAVLQFEANLVYTIKTLLTMQFITLRLQINRIYVMHIYIICIINIAVLPIRRKNTPFVL